MPSSGWSARTTAPGPSTVRSVGGSVCGGNVHVLRNHSVGRTWIGAASGPRLWTVIRQTTSSASALA